MKKRKLENLVNLCIGLITLFFSIFLSIKAFQNPPSNNYFYLIALLPFYWLSYLFLSTALIRISYFNFEKSNEIEINEINKEIIFLNKSTGKKRRISRELIEKIELFFSWNTNPFSSDLGYSKITLNDGTKVFITQYMVPQADVRCLFKYKVKKVKHRFMNRLR